MWPTATVVGVAEQVEVLPALQVVALKYSILLLLRSATYTKPLVGSTTSALGTEDEGRLTVAVYALVEALYTATVPLLFPTYSVDPFAASAAGALRCPPEATCVGWPQPLVVDWLQVLVENTVSVLPPAFATKTFPTDESSAMASGADPVDTVLAVTALNALVPPSLSTLTVLLD